MHMGGKGSFPLNVGWNVEWIKTKFFSNASNSFHQTHHGPNLERAHHYPYYSQYMIGTISWIKMYKSPKTFSMEF